MSSPAITSPARGPNGTSADRALRGLATVADAAAPTQSTTASIDADAFKGLSIAVVIPCFNEERSIAGVIADSRHPCLVWISTIRQWLDRFNARVRLKRGRSCSATRRGKGNVRRMSRMSMWMCTSWPTATAPTTRL